MSGVATVHGSVRSSSVDVAAAVIRAAFASAGIVAADQFPAARLIVISPPPFRQMEELGLQNFR